jgi:hypothetical protein
MHADSAAIAGGVDERSCTLRVLPRGSAVVGHHGSPAWVREQKRRR